MNQTIKMDAMDMLLYSAVPYMKPRELEEYEAAEPTIFLTEREKKKFLKRITREKEYHERHEVYRPVLEGLKRAAVIVLIIMSACFTSVMSIDSVRAAFLDTIMEWFEEYIFVGYTISETECLNKIDEYKEPKIADEYVRRIVKQSPYKFLVEYKTENALLMYQQEALYNYGVMLSNNETIINEININENLGYMITFMSDGTEMISFIWNDSLYTYQLTGDVSYQEMMTIAESID